MPGVALLAAFVAIMLFVAAYQGTSNLNGLAKQLDQDIFGAGTGSTGFLLWAGIIGFIAVMGSVLHMSRAAKLFMTLIIVVYLLKNGNGFFSQLQTAFAGASPGSTATTAGEGQAVTGGDVATGPATTTAQNVQVASAAATSPGLSASGILQGVITGASAMPANYANSPWAALLNPRASVTTPGSNTGASA